jgi:hypothetical protein
MIEIKQGNESYSVKYRITNKEVYDINFGDMPLLKLNYS